MKNHSRSNAKRGKLGYRTPSSFRFTTQQRTRVDKVKNKFTNKD